MFPSALENHCFKSIKKFPEKTPRFYDIFQHIFYDRMAAYKKSIYEFYGRIPKEELSGNDIVNETASYLPIHFLSEALVSY